MAFKRAKESLEKAGLHSKPGAALEKKIDAAYSVLRGEMPLEKSGLIQKQKTALINYENARRKLSRVSGKKISEIEVTAKTRRTMKTSAQAPTAKGTI